MAELDYLPFFVQKTKSSDTQFGQTIGVDQYYHTIQIMIYFTFQHSPGSIEIINTQTKKLLKTEKLDNDWNTNTRNNEQRISK